MLSEPMIIVMNGEPLLNLVISLKSLFGLPYYWTQGSQLTMAVGMMQILVCPITCKQVYTSMTNSILHGHLNFLTTLMNVWGLIGL